MIRSILFIILLVSSFYTFSGQSNINVQDFIIGDTFLIGDPIMQVIYVAGPQDIEVNIAHLSEKSFFAMLDDTVGLNQDSIEIEIAEVNVSDSIYKDGLLVRTFAIRMMAFDSARVKIPSFPIHVKQGAYNISAQTKSKSILINYFPIEKYPVDIYETHNTPFIWAELIPLLWLLMVIILLGGLGYIGFYLWKKRNQPSNEEVVYSGPPHEIALQKLQEIRSASLLEQGLIKDYHSGISDTLREYIENRFDIRAMEMTTAEITKELRANRHLLSKPLTKELIAQLALSDLVKFAKMFPEQHANENLLEFAVRFVLETKHEEEFKEDEETNQETS